LGQTKNSGGKKEKNSGEEYRRPFAVGVLKLNGKKKKKFFLL
jgi:hypothetical protein